jgi:hypothetical protein
VGRRGWGVPYLWNAGGHLACPGVGCPAVCGVSGGGVCGGGALLGPERTGFRAGSGSSASPVCGEGGGSGVVRGVVVSVLVFPVF